MSVKSIREDLHQIPEIGRHEFKTKDYILSIARTLSCEIYEPTPTGLVLYFHVGRKHTIAFRADMDALPVVEETNAAYASLHPGFMHACGHDGHMAMLLEFAIWASAHKNELTRNIVCLFQPSEEEEAGAIDILKSNILKDLAVEEMYGFHIWPTLEKGILYSMPLGMLATSGEVNIHIHGKSVHAANRKQGIDSILVATKIIDEFYEFEQTIPERHLISFGKISGGTARNVVAQDCYLEATMRAFDDATFNRMVDFLEALLKKLEYVYHAKIDLHINQAYPSVINHPDLFQKNKEYLQITKLEEPFMQAEDFGNYTRAFPSLFMLIGCGKDNPLLHTSTFDFDEDLLDIGVETYKKLAVQSS